MSLVSRILKANPSIQVSDVLAGTFTVPSAKAAFVDLIGNSARALFGGGSDASASTNIIDYFNIITLGNATDFGDLVRSRQELAGNCSSSTRALFDYNAKDSVFGWDYVTIASTGNATNFGNFSLNMYEVAGLSSSTRGIFGGGRMDAPYVDISSRIEYITIATTGNGTSFGDQNTGVRYCAGLASTTRGLFGGGYRNDGSNDRNEIQYVTIATTGNAQSFGTLTNAAYNLGAASSGTRGIFAGGNTDSGRINVINYVTIATTGNATDFGDLSSTRSGIAGTSNNIRAVFGGGYDTAIRNFIDYILFASTGNAVDFGDLTVGRANVAANSAGHGGL